MAVPKKVLESLGLSDKEAKVYLASLELGPSPVQKIASKAEINRTTAYSNLESLSKKGLISTVKKGVKEYFAAENPEHLKSLIAKKEEELKLKSKELEEILPDLNKKHEYAGERPVVRFYEGKETLAAIEREIIQKTPKRKVGYGFLALDQYEKKVSSAKGNNRIRKEIKLKTLYTNKSGPIPNADNPAALREAVYLTKKEVPYNSSIQIYEDKVSLASFSDRVVGVIIENKEIAGTLKEIFRIAFEAKKKDK